MHRVWGPVGSHSLYHLSRQPATAHAALATGANHLIEWPQQVPCSTVHIFPEVTAALVAAAATAAEAAVDWAEPATRPRPP